VISGLQRRSFQKGSDRLEPTHFAILTCVVAAVIGARIVVKQEHFVCENGQFWPSGETLVLPRQSGPFGATQRLRSNVIHSKFSVCRLAAACLLWPLNRATSVAVRLQQTTWRV